MARSMQGSAAFADRSRSSEDGLGCYLDHLRAWLISTCGNSVTCPIFFSVYISWMLLWLDTKASSKTDKSAHMHMHVCYIYAHTTPHHTTHSSSFSTYSFLSWKCYGTTNGKRLQRNEKKSPLFVAPPHLHKKLQRRRNNRLLWLSW